MKWQRGYRSEDVQDLRGRSGRASVPSAGLMQLGVFLFQRFGIAGVVIAVLIYGGLQFLGGGSSGGGASVAGPTNPAEEELFQFASFVFDDAQRTWTQKFAEEGKTYRKASMAIFRSSVASACGGATAAVGPFYCPGDQKVYIDLSFYQALRERLGAPGDFAQAYVIAHEVGHHVQHLTGKLGRNDAGDGGGSVRAELQADCYAGVWAHDTSRRDLLDAGDLDEAMTAARAIGDDTLAQNAGQAVRPESWTHGSAAQRKRWFERGVKQGTLAACDTFAASSL